MPEPATKIGELKDVTVRIKLDATMEGVFDLQAVNTIALQRVLRELNELKEKGITPPFLYNLYGRVYTLMGDEERARRNHEISIKLASSDASHYLDYAHSLELFNKIKEAIELYEKGFKIDPTIAGSWKLYIGCLVKLERFKKAYGEIKMLKKLKKEETYLECKALIDENHFPTEEEISKELIQAVRTSEKDIREGRSKVIRNSEELTKFFVDL